MDSGMSVEKYPDPTWTNKIEHIDGKGYVNVRVTKVISVGDMHFIYLESTDNYVNMNLGVISYTGELKPVVVQDAVARYKNDGTRVDFAGWTLQRDENGNWGFQINNIIKQVVKPELPEPQPQPQPQSQAQTKPVKKAKPVQKTTDKEENEDLYEVFKFYLDAFSILCREDEEKTSTCKKAGIVNTAAAKRNDLRRVLFVVQNVMTKEFPDGQTRSTIIRNELIQNGVIKLRIYKTFVEKMIIAWDCDVKEEIISKKGVFLHNPEESAILALEWGGYTPNAEENLFDKINEIIKNRVLNNSVNDFSRARLGQKKQTSNHQKTL